MRGSRAARSARARTEAANSAAVAPKAASSSPSPTASRVPTGVNGALVSRSATSAPTRRGEQVGPVLRAVEAAHVPVVGVEHHVLARDDAIGRERERHAAGGGVAGQGGDDEMRVGLHDLAHDVVDRLQVQPRRDRRIVGGLDHVQMDAIGEEIGAAHEHEDLGLTPQTCEQVGVAQAPALLRAHRAVVEVEAQIADLRVLLVDDLAEGVPVGQRGVDGHRDLGRVDRDAGEGERARRGELVAHGSLEVGDPDGAVRRRAADRAVARGDDGAGLAAQPALAVDAEEVKRRRADRVEHAGVTLRGTQPAYDRVRRVGGPVDGAHLLGHERAVLAADPHAGRTRLGDALHRFDDRLDRGAADLVAIQAALAGRPHGERPAGPDRPGVEVAVGLEDGDAPVAGTHLDGPVQRGGPAVPRRTGVHDQAAMRRPDGLRDELLEHRAHDEIGPVSRDRRLHRLGRVDHRHLDLVPELREGDPGALAEAVVSGGEEEDAHSSKEVRATRFDPVRPRTRAWSARRYWSSWSTVQASGALSSRQRCTFEPWRMRPSET